MTAVARTGSGARKLEGPRGHLLFGCAPAIRRRGSRFHLDMTRNYGPVSRYRYFTLETRYMSHPDAIARVLQFNQRNYDKESFDYKVLREVLGVGVLTSSGQEWLTRRRMLQPSFHKALLPQYGRAMSEIAEETARSWETRSGAEWTINVLPEMSRLTLRVVGRALFGLELAGVADTVSWAMDVSNRVLSDYTYVPFPPLFVPTPSHREQARARQVLDRIANWILSQGREEDANLLGRMLAYRDPETGQRESAQSLRNEIVTLLLAGHETTATLLGWTWHMLAQHPEVEAKLHSELDAVLSGRPAEYGDLDSLPYTRTVIEETLRMFPPAWLLNRRAVEEDEVCGYHVERGSLVIACPYATHRHPEFWDDPERFHPERFAAGNGFPRHRYAYYPFGGGPRQCIGSDFAFAEARLVLATLAQRFVLRPTGEEEVRLVPMITLRPGWRLPMTVRPR